MKCALVGSRYFGAAVFEVLRKEDGVEFTRVVAPAVDDRLAIAARAAGVKLHVLENPKLVPGAAILEGTELIVAAHTHARVSPQALARSRLGGIGYHPSLLPRHRGIAAVEWTILEGDPIAGGSIYHLADGWDAGSIAAQDWCFVAKGETARELWERALAPMGLDLLARVVRHARDRGELPAKSQDPRFMTEAPMIRRSVVLTEDQPAPNTSLVVTVMGPDRPGIVARLTRILAAHGVSIEHMHTEIVRADASRKPTFKVAAHLRVPPAVATESLRSELAVLAHEMMVDVTLGERASGDTTTQGPAPPSMD